MRLALAAATVLAWPGLIMAQTPTASDIAPAAVEATAPQSVRIPAGTTIVVEFTETLSSRTSQTGQLVSLRLAEPIAIDGQTIVEAGAAGGGEVIDAAHSGIGGRNGKLIISGRYIEIAGQRARIRGLQAVLAGEDNSREAVTAMIVVPYVGWVGGFITGGEIEIPAGTRAQARLAADIAVPPSAMAIQTAAAVEPTSEVEE